MFQGGDEMTYDANKKFNWDVASGYPLKIENSHLVCKDCLFKMNAVVECVQYTTKPVKVLKGEQCEKYKNRLEFVRKHKGKKE